MPMSDFIFGYAKLLNSSLLPVGLLGAVGLLNQIDYWLAELRHPHKTFRLSRLALLNICLSPLLSLPYLCPGSENPVLWQGGQTSEFSADDHMNSNRPHFYIQK